MAKKIRIGQIGDIAATRLLGRYSASTGGVQEIILGTNLVLTTAGVLNATNSTYSNMSLAELTAGTVTTARTISAKTLNDWINSKGFITSAPNTVTRLRGSTSGTYVSGDVSIVAGANTTVTQSGQTITIASENATYSAMSLAELTTGTVTTNRIVSAKTLNDWINSKGYSTTNTTYAVFTRSVNGLVPAPGGTTTTRFLREDGTWVVPTNTNTTYSTGTLAQLQAGTDTTGRLHTAKILNDWINGKGFVTTDTNTTYSAGAGLTLSGTTFSLPVTISGSGTFVQSVVQTTNGITVTLGTPPNTNTTYALVTQAAINAGTETTGRLISAKLLADNFFKKPTGTTSQYIRGDGSLATYANTTYAAGTLALLNAGTDTVNRVWSAKILADYVQANSGGGSGFMTLNTMNSVVNLSWGIKWSNYEVAATSGGLTTRRSTGESTMLDGRGVSINSGTANMQITEGAIDNYSSNSRAVIRFPSTNNFHGSVTIPSTTVDVSRTLAVSVNGTYADASGNINISGGGGGANLDDIVTRPAFGGTGIQHSEVFLRLSGLLPNPLGNMDAIAGELYSSPHKASGELWTNEALYSKVVPGQICGFYGPAGSQGDPGILGGMAGVAGWYYNHQSINNNAWMSLITYSQISSGGTAGGALPTTKLGFCTAITAGGIYNAHAQGTILLRGWAYLEGFESNYNDGSIFLMVPTARLSGVGGAINQHKLQCMNQSAVADLVCIGVLRHQNVAYIDMNGLVGPLHGN